MNYVAKLPIVLSVVKFAVDNVVEETVGSSVDSSVVSVLSSGCVTTSCIIMAISCKFTYQ